MKLKQLAVTVLIVALAIGATAPAVAQSGNSTTTTSTTTEASPDGSPNVTVGPTTKIVDWEFADDSARIDFVTRVPTRVTVVQAVRSGNSGTGNLDAYNLDRGRVSIDFPLNGGPPQLSLFTPAGTQSGRYAFIQARGSGPVVSGPWTWADTALSVLVFGLAISIGMVFRAVRDRFGDGAREVIAE